MSIIQDITAALQAPFRRRSESAAAVDQVDQSIGNGYVFYQRDAADANDLPVIGYDTDNALRVGGEAYIPTRTPLIFHVYPNASLVTQTFFVNPTPHALAITLSQEIHTTAGTDAGAVSATVTHETQVGGLMQAAGTGKAINTAVYNMKGTAETLQTGTLAANFRLQSRNTPVSSSSPGAGLIVLQPGDALSVKFAGVTTALVGVTITAYVMPGTKYDFAVYYLAPAGAAVTRSVMTSMRPRTLLYGAALWQTAEATAATLTLDVTKDASATVPGAGTSMLAATANLKSAALTYTQLGLSATAANLSLNSTDSVAVKISASTTELAGICVVLAFDGKLGEVSLFYNPLNSTVGTNEEWFIADRDYQVGDIAAKWSIVSTSNTSGLTIDTGTQTPSTGVVAQTDNTNAGFLTSGTVNVPVFGTLAAQNTLFLRKGDRLGIKNAGTLGTLAGFQMSVRLFVA